MRLHQFTSHINSCKWLLPGIIAEEGSEALPRLQKMGHRNQLTLTSAVKGHYSGRDKLKSLFLLLTFSDSLSVKQVIMIHLSSPVLRSTKPTAQSRKETLFRKNSL